MDSIYDIWQQVLPTMFDEVGETAYKVWLTPLLPISMSATDFILQVKSNMHREVISSRFTTLIEDRLRDYLGIDLKVKYVIEEEIKKMNFLPPELANTGYEYTFETFIVGSSNRFAHAAALAVSQNPGRAYNPLFIYGNSGLGKTHLLLAISNQIMRNKPSANIVYIKGDEFTNELIEAIAKGQQLKFREKYRYADALLMDDIQFIGGKVSTEEEFFHTFNYLYQEKKQIVLTSDRPPREISTLEERLRSRFESGLLADVQTPEFETRVAIIKRKAAQFQNFDLPDNIAEFIAGQLKSNIRQLEGVVKNMYLLYSIDKERPTINTARNVISEILTTDIPPIPLTIDKIIEEVARHFSVTAEDIYSSKRSQPLSIARQAAMYCVREVTAISYDEIGKKFNNRDHSTVIYAVGQVETKMKSSPEFRNAIDDIIKNIKS